MIARALQRTRIGVLPVLIIGMAVGCEKKTPDGNPPSAQTGAARASTDDDPGGAEVEARLARADAADGAADKIIRKCASCSLAMDGTPEHALTAHGYTMQFCSDHCRDRFADDTDAAIMAMQLPAP